MILCRDEMWNGADVYGPPADLERFKRASLIPNPTIAQIETSALFSEDAIVTISSPKFEIETWNFRVRPGTPPWHYSFAFDTGSDFPEFVFEDLALTYPTLSFDCDCIADDDRSMGYGWFNPPPGGEPFDSDYSVPDGYWTEGGCKQSPSAELRHQARLSKLSKQLQRLTP